MWKAAARVVCHKRVRALSHFRLVLILLLFVLSAVMLFIIMDGQPQPRGRVEERPHIPTFDIPYKSPASVYRQKAAYVAPRQRAPVDADADSDADNAFEAPSPQQPPPRGMLTRARRQEALEEEIDKYLASHGIHRERRLRVRFEAVTDFVDWSTCTTIGSAALGGYNVALMAFSEKYSHVRRVARYIEFADHEGLEEDDIVVVMDSDVFWNGADFVPFLSKFARFSPESEADLDVAAVRAWEDYGEKKAPLFMQELQAQANGSEVKRPDMQIPPVLVNGEDNCWWGQHSQSFVDCAYAFTVLDHLIEVARNHVSTYNANRSSRFIRESGDALRRELTRLFPGNSRWMVDDMMREPNASSPYTTKAQRDRSDPLFYHTANYSDTVTMRLNSGLWVARVWALRQYVQTMFTLMAMEKPIIEAGHSEWHIDQGAMGEIYTRQRLFEVEHNLLTGPPLSARTPPLPLDPRFGPLGLIGIERRSEMTALAYMFQGAPQLFHHSAYLNRHFPSQGGSGANVTEARLGSSDPTGERLDDLRLSRGGALVTPPLLWLSATTEDRTRGYNNTVETDADVVYPAFLHYAGGPKDQKFVSQRHHFAWLVAARHNRRAKQALNKILSEELVELWYEDARVYVDYFRMCKDPTELPSKRPLNR